MRLDYIDEKAEPANAEEAAIVERIKQRRGSLGLLHLDKALLLSPPVANGWNAFIGAIRDGTKLPESTRELIISRVAGLNKAWYSWDPHHQYLINSGIPSDVVEKLKDKDYKGEGLDEKHKAVLEYIDAMTLKVWVRPEVVDGLRKLYSDREVLELTTSIAAFNCVSRFLVALDVGEKLTKHGEGEY